MTHTTDQEPVTLPLYLVNNLLALCTPEDHELRDRVKQAARRAQVVPKGWSLRDAAQDALDWLEDEDLNLTHNIRERLRFALAAAPQPSAEQQAAHKSALGDEGKALAALRYYMHECSGAEPSISVFHRMAEEALEAAAPQQPEARDHTT